MHDYVLWHCSIDYFGYIKPRQQDFMQKNLLSYLKEIISAQLLWGNMLLRGELQKNAISSNLIKSLKRSLYEISEYAFKIKCMCKRKF